MITISTCMIVKNEEKMLSRCLECVRAFSDEIIIVDTGSTDRTKEIAAAYTDKIYDFEWINDFSAARNFSFSKATKEYIYIADADEVIDEANIRQILDLKKILLPEIDIVQMYYTNQLEFGTTYNYDKEYRPKLVKRLRQFVWQDPLHETIKLEPVIYDSDIAIIHKPHESHSARDFANLQRMTEAGTFLSPKLNIMYAKELFIAGEQEDFLAAQKYFERLLENVLQDNELRAVQCVLVKCYALNRDAHRILGAALKHMANGDGSSEVCTCLGQYYEEAGEYGEAVIWYYNGAYETQSELSLRYSREIPLQGLIRCYQALNDGEQAAFYTEELEKMV
ncbi:MAG: glycosyltransferase family 2 protein [Clostridium sp.]|nr:glycosyltransferase family 2 protein [Clostridium sp.]